MGHVLLTSSSEEEFKQINLTMENLFSFLSVPPWHDQDMFFFVFCGLFPRKDKTNYQCRLKILNHQAAVSSALNLTTEGHWSYEMNLPARTSGFIRVFHIFQKHVYILKVLLHVSHAKVYTWKEVVFLLSNKHYSLMSFTSTSHPAFPHFHLSKNRLSYWVWE